MLCMTLHIFGSQKKAKFVCVEKRRLEKNMIRRFGVKQMLEDGSGYVAADLLQLISACTPQTHAGACAQEKDASCGSLRDRQTKRKRKNNER